MPEYVIYSYPLIFGYRGIVYQVTRSNDVRKIANYEIMSLGADTLVIVDGHVFEVRRYNYDSVIDDAAWIDGYDELNIRDYYSTNSIAPRWVRLLVIWKNNDILAFQSVWPQVTEARLISRIQSPHPMVQIVCSYGRWIYALDTNGDLYRITEQGELEFVSDDIYCLAPTKMYYCAITNQGLVWLLKDVLVQSRRVIEDVEYLYKMAYGPCNSSIAQNY